VANARAGGSEGEADRFGLAGAVKPKPPAMHERSALEEVKHIGQMKEKDQILRLIGRRKELVLRNKPRFKGGFFENINALQTDLKECLKRGGGNHP